MVRTPEPLQPRPPGGWARGPSALDTGWHLPAQRTPLRWPQGGSSSLASSPVGPAGFIVPPSDPAEQSLRNLLTAAFVKVAASLVPLLLRGPRWEFG